MKPSALTPGPGVPPALSSPRGAGPGGRRGFTLLELLVTIAPIVGAALAGILYPRLSAERNA